MLLAKLRPVPVLSMTVRTVNNFESRRQASTAAQLLEMDKAIEITDDMLYGTRPERWYAWSIRRVVKLICCMQVYWTKTRVPGVPWRSCEWHPIFGDYSCGYAYVMESSG
jgi:hypothetical protein